MEKTLAQALHSALVAQCNCQEKKNTDWDLKWGQRIKQLMDLAPSGSGFNAGTQLVKWDAGPDYVQIQTFDPSNYRFFWL